MRRSSLKNYLSSIGFNLTDDIQDRVKRLSEQFRNKENSNPNYERGVLLYALLNVFDYQSYCEIGSGRGFSSMCAAMSMHDRGLQGRVVSVDPEFRDPLRLKTIDVPDAYWQMFEHIKGSSMEVLPDEHFDLIYIDGDHSYDYVLNDWKWAKKHGNVIVFDDYAPSSRKKDVHLVVDVIEHEKHFVQTFGHLYGTDLEVPDDYGMVVVQLPR